MKRLIALLSALFVLPVFSQTNPNATGQRIYSGPVGTGADLAAYQAFIIPGDQQQGIPLDGTGSNSPLFGGATGSGLPWFMRIQRTAFYTYSALPVPPSGPTYAEVTNPVAAYGEAGGGTPLYTDREYRFGLYAGGRNLDRAGGFRIRAYQKSQFSGAAMNQTPVESKEFSVPFRGDGNWDGFLTNGLKQVENFRGLRVSVEMLSGNSATQWHGLENPYILTLSCADPDAYFVIDSKGWVSLDLPLASTSFPPSTSNPAFRPCFSVDFTARPPWRSAYIDSPHFTGEAAPSDYSGMSVEELSGLGGFAPPVPGAAYETATAVDQTPELRQHPKLDKLVEDLGNDPVAIANYVHNEIKLVDPLGYSENAEADPSGIWAGGMNRNAFATYMEGGGNPWEQCALLVYMMRKAGYAAVYVEPVGDSLLMLDTQLDKLLRMRIKGATDSAGEQRMSVEVPVHYPWVAVHVPDEENPGQKKWVHLFPWMKDTSVVEGGNLYERFPEACKSGSEWVRKYLHADSSVMGELSAAHQPNGDGNILVEAERYQDSVAGGETLHNTSAGIDRWNLKTDTGNAGYSGDSWVEAVGGGSVSAFTTADKAPKLEYVVDLPAAGTYYVWLRAYAGHSYRRCFVSMDGQPYATLQIASGSGWQWGNKDLSNVPVGFTVTSAGRHTLRIAANQSAFALDRVLVTANASLTPTGDGGTLSVASPVGPNVPSHHFMNYAREKLAAHGVSLDGVGMRHLDRKNNRASLEEFPRPYRLDEAAHTIYSKLSERPDTFDTVRVYLAKDPMAGTNFHNPNVKLDTGDWLSMDLHNRPFYINARRYDLGKFRLMITLGAFREAATGSGNFVTGDKAAMQRATVNFTYIGNDEYSNESLYNNPYYTMEVTHIRQRRAILGNIVRVEVTNQGTGYAFAPSVTIAPPPNLATNPSYRTATAVATVASGQVTGIQIVDPGYGYDYDSAAPAVTLTGGGGSGATATAAAPSRTFGANGADLHPLGVRSTSKHISRPTISEGDLGAICLTFGNVSQRMVDHLAEDYWSYERRMKANASEANNIEFKEAVQGRSAYLVGMDYYRRVSEFRDRNADLHKSRILSMYAAGLSKLQALRQSYWYGTYPGYELYFNDVLPINGQFYHNKPSVDMFFAQMVSTMSGAAHTDAGFPSVSNNKDMWAVFTAEMSAQEHQIINDYYREDAAISTVRLLQRAHTNQDRVTPAKGVIRLTKGNHVGEGNQSYARGPVNKPLKDWNGPIWTSIQNIFAGDEGHFSEVFITPGNVSSSSLSYNGMGAMLLGKNETSALIGGNAGFYNGGFGSVFPVARFESNYLPSNTLTLGATGYTLHFGSGATSSSSLVAAAASLWQIPTTYSNLGTGTATATSYQTSAWGQQASAYGLSGTLASNYRAAESRGSIGSTSFFGALGNSIRSIGSAIGTIASQIGGFVSDPVDVVTGDFYVDAVDLTLPGPMPLTLRRNYSSLSVADGEFGHGWKSSILPFIGVGDNDLLYAAEADGSVIAYRKDSGDANLFVPSTADNPALKNLNQEEAGGSSNPMNNRIVKSVESGDTWYTLSGPNGNVRRFKVRQFPVGSGANLITRERPYLESWTDAQGNQLAFTYYDVNTESNYGQLAKITASNGNSLGFNYDVSGHIVEAWTQDGRRISYEYDTQGDLKKVILPDGAEHRYDYAEEITLIGGETARTSKHLLIRETKPGGRILENDYDDQRRVLRQRAVVGPTALPVQNAEFIYANTQNTDKTWTGTTTVKDAYGRPTVFSYIDSLITSEDDPETPAELRAWYGATETGGGAYPRSLKSITDRRGVVKFFKYDSRGNLIEKSLGTDLAPADIDGDGIESAGEKSVTSWTYNGRDLPETQTEPSGIVTKWFYDDPIYPYLASRTEKWSGATFISRTRRQFTSETAGGRFAKGLIEWEKVAEGTPDEAVVEWEYSERGFPTKKTSRTGTTDPDVVVSLRHNLRGELIEEKQLSSGGAPERTWVHAYDAMGRKTISTRSGGTVTATEQTHYTLNGEVEWTDGARTGVNDRVLNRYDSHGRLIEKLEWLSPPMADGSGVGAHVNSDDSVATTFYSYDLFNNLIEIRTPGRHSIAADYDSIGRLKKLDHYSGYKGQGGVIKGSREFEYEPGGEVSEETDTLGGVTKNYYHDRGQLRRRENPDGSVEEWRFYPDGRPHREILRNGSYKELVYDDANRTVTETLKAADHSVIKTAVSLHDRRGNLISETKGGYTTVTTYDSLDRVKSVTGPPATPESAQRIDTYSYPDPHGRRTLVTNALGETTLTLRDALDRVVSIERKNGDGSTASIVTHEYSSDQNKVTTTEGSGADAIVTEQWTDTMGRTILVRRADGTFTATGYSPPGDPVIERDTDGSQTTRLFDWQGLPLREVRPGNVIVEFVHDSAGNLLERKMPGGMTAKAQFDSVGRVTETKLVQGAATTRLTTYAYYPTGHVWAGMLQSTTDARGIVTTRTYDSRLRLATAISDGPDPEDDLSRSFSYDELDHLVSVTETGINGTTVVNRPASDAGAILSETVSVGGTVQSAVSQKFDGAGRRSLRTVGDFSQSFAHRGDGLLSSTTVGNRVYHSTFTTAGHLAGRNGPFQSQIIGRDALGRVTSRVTDAGGAEVLNEAIGSGAWLGWSDADQLYNLTRSMDGGAERLIQFNYDASHRLVIESHPPGVGTGGNDIPEYYYDGYSFNTTGGLGVLVARNRSNNTPQTQMIAGLPDSGDFGRIGYSEYQGLPRPVPLAGIAFGAKGVELSLNGRPVTPVVHPGWQDAAGAWSAHANLPGGSYTLTATAIHPSGTRSTPATSTFTVTPRNENLNTTHDETGNVVSRTWTGGTSQALTWDARNRLVKVVQTGVNPFVWTALYDGLDRRIRTTFTPQGGDAATIRQVYDPEAEFLEIGQGVSIGCGSIGWSWKVYGVDQSGTFGGLEGLGGLEAVRDAKGQWRGIVSDWWGNTAGWIEKPGDGVTWNGTPYTAWGNVIGYATAVQDGKMPLHQLLGYRGLTTDPPGFHQMGLRAYDPVAGTWLSPDPLGHAGSMSLYDYCDNDPVNMADPDGRFGKAVWKGTATYLTGYSGDTTGMSGSQIWNSYRNSEVGMIHARQWDSALNFVPGVNVLKWSAEGISGRNFITGADLTIGQQIGSVFSVGVSVLPAPIMAWSSSATSIGAGSTFANPNVIKGGFQNVSKPWGHTPSAGTFNTGGTTTLNFKFGQNLNPTTHKNSLAYVGETHVYRVKGPDGSTYKIGESARGVRVTDGASIRAEQQARRLTRETGDYYQSEIRKVFPDKASARAYETKVIERFRRLYGPDSLPGNKTNR